MRNEVEEFISQVVLTRTYNNECSGDVEAPTGYFGTMTFEENETEVDGIEIPEALRNHTVTAILFDNGNIEYDILTEDFLDKVADGTPREEYKLLASFIAETWYDAICQDFDKWYGDDD